MNYKLRVEGEIPTDRPVMLAPVHRTSVDIYAISYILKEMIAYVSTDSFGHSRVANAVQKWLTTALGSVVWQERGIANRRQRAVVLTRAIEQRLSDRLIVAAFTQGRYQPFAVETVEDGMVGMLQRHESRHLKKHGERLKVPVIPVGIEYDCNGEGLTFAKTADRLARFIPFFPQWTVPSFGSKITIRFGNPHYASDGTATDITRSVMREAAELSNIPYQAS